MYNPKKAQVTEDEVNSNSQVLLISLKDMLKERQEGVDRVNKMFGLNITVDISEEFMIETLEKLECKVENGVITVPTFRNDLTCMNDIAEEIIRIYGYNDIKSSKIILFFKRGINYGNKRKHHL